MRFVRAAHLPVLLAASLTLAPVAKAETIETGEAVARAVEAAEAGAWTSASSLAGRTRDPVAADMIAWMRLREGVGDWQEYQSFFARNPDWPNLAALRRHAERVMPAHLPGADVIRFFGAERPSTGAGALRLATALEDAGQGALARIAILRAWRSLPMTAAEAEAILARHAPLVAGHDVARLDMLLWRGFTAEAARMLPRVPADWQALAKARIAVRQDANGTTAMIEALPDAVRRDPGLAYERYLYRVREGRWDEAEAFLIAQSTSAAALGEPDLWMERRANLARMALRRGDVAAAYALAARNHGNRRSGADYADAEWVAGFVALTRMDDPAAAARHFERFREAVATPISLGRAGYWLGLAEERAGNSAAAQAAWVAAAAHQTSFYGQLAAEKAGVAADPGLAGEAEPPGWRGPTLMRNPVVRAGVLFGLAGDEARAALFLRHAADALPAPQRAALAQMAIDTARPHLGLRIAKDAAADGVLIPNQYYPLHDMAEGDWPIPTELALAVARQESEFNPRAVSPAGARGLMQLMPGTAREVSDQLGVDYDLGRLTDDPTYNARLGAAYLLRMLDAYDGSYLLAAAAYNAGPGRVREWLEAFGDPRQPQADAILWIESIPFEETRNYVMRVLESLHVYRARLDGAPVDLRLAADIERAGPHEIRTTRSARTRPASDR